MYKANQFQELTNKIKSKEEEKRIQEQERQKRIQSDAKLVEDSLNDLYIKIEKNANLGLSVPKYVEIPKILEKEVQDNLVLEQGFFLDITRQAHTRIYYNKEDFEGRIKTDNSKSYPLVDMVHKVNEGLREIKQNKNAKAMKQDGIYNINPIVIGDKETIDLANTLGKLILSNMIRDRKNSGVRY